MLTGCLEPARLVAGMVKNGSMKRIEVLDPIGEVKSAE